MKLNSFSRGLIWRGTMVAAIALGLTYQAMGQNAFFDVNGTTAGYGTVDTGSYSWDDANWATVTGGAGATANWVQGSFARFLGTGSYSVTVNNTETNSGLFQAVAVNSGFTVTINSAGAGNLWITNNAGLTTGLPVQGFFCNGGNTVVINAPITGPGGINFGLISGTGNIFLNGNNSYTGGSTLTTSSYVINFNNNNAFGSGPININGTTFANLLSQGGSPITLPNNFTNTANSGINFGSAVNTPVISSGPWALQTFNLNLRNNGDSSAPLTLSGPISGSGNISLSGNSGGTIIFSGANTYSGQTTISAGNLGVTLSVASLNSVSGGTPTSNLGHPTTAAAGTISIGGGIQTSTLLYTGPGETSDRVINLSGTTGGAIIQADGTGPLVLTAVNTATGAGAKTLKLQGSNTGANSIGKIVDGASPTGVLKDQAGTWKLTGANTYSGGTTLNQGNLEITGSTSGNVTNIGGLLTLDNASTLSSSATLTLNSGNPGNLNFTGTNGINTLIIDGSTAVSGVWGPIGSAAPNQNAVFTGTGYINVLGKPVIVQQPVSGTVFPNDSFTFNVQVAGDLTTLTYQWKHDGNNVSGANTSSLTISPVEAIDAGVYTCWVTNAFGFTNTLGATLTVLGTNAYTQTVRGDSPMAYWRLGETNGTLAYDAVGGNLGQYRNVLLNQPGFSLTDPNPGIGLPGPAAGRGFVSVTNNSQFAFLGGASFTLEGWAYFTNLSGVQSLFSTFALSGGNGWRFGINGANAVRFTAGAVADIDQTVNPPLVAGVWYHLVCTSDGGQYHFYVNGVEQGTGQPVATPTGLSQPLTLGCNPVAYTNNNTGDPLGEQIKGLLDEMAVYGSQLSSDQVSNHYFARYADAAAPVPSAPVAVPPTNYVSLSTTLQEDAAGQNLTYQWYKAPSTLINNATNSTLTLSPLQLSDAGGYYVKVSGLGGVNSNSPITTIGVLPIPTNAIQLNLTNNLVLHLPFDGTYGDISGRAHDGTNVGATTFVTDGALGQALHYFTDTSLPSTNYVTLGVPGDLQFGTSTDFTVAYWVRQPDGSSFTNLPFLANEPVGSTAGWMFSPYRKDDLTFGGWFEAIGSMTSPSAFTSFPDSNLINDNKWHHLVHSASRAANVITYLDGVQVDSQAIGFLGSISTTTPVNIGQDSSGTYAVTASADIDDVGMWQRALSQLEVSGMYLAGASNHVSFALAVPGSLSIQQVAPGQWQISWPGLAGTLQAAGDVTGSYTNVPGATSPYTVPTASASELFYRLMY